MTNTVSLVLTGAGSVIGSKPELTGRRRVIRLGIVTAMARAPGRRCLALTPEYLHRGRAGADRRASLAAVAAQIKGFPCRRPRTATWEEWSRRGPVRRGHVVGISAPRGVHLLVVLSMMIDASLVT